MVLKSDLNIIVQKIIDYKKESGWGIIQSEYQTQNQIHDPHAILIPFVFSIPSRWPLHFSFLFKSSTLHLSKPTNLTFLPHHFAQVSFYIQLKQENVQHEKQENHRRIRKFWLDKCRPNILTRWYDHDNKIQIQ